MKTYRIIYQIREAYAVWVDAESEEEARQEVESMPEVDLRACNPCIDAENGVIDCQEFTK